VGRKQGSGEHELEVSTGGGRLELRSRGRVARRDGSLDPPPTGDHLPVTTGLPLREECWDLLPPEVAHRMTELAGEQIEWWAHSPRARPRIIPSGYDDRPSAVLIGTNGACFAEPRINSLHQPVYTISCHRLDPNSHRHAEVIYRPTKSEVRPEAAPDSGRSTPALRDQPVPGLDPEASKLLSNLPGRAQKLVTAPFTADHPVRERQWHYEGRANRFDVFAVVLIGANHLTLAHGSRVIPVGHSEQASHWSLICRRAKVLGQLHE
jgi:hypothetical protein